MSSDSVSKVFIQFEKNMLGTFAVLYHAYYELRIMERLVNNRSIWNRKSERLLEGQVLNSGFYD